MKNKKAISNVIGMASASPFEFSIFYRPNLNATLNFTEKTFDIISDKTLNHAIYFPIKTNGTIQMDQCINITKTNITEVFECP